MTDITDVESIDRVLIGDREFLLNEGSFSIDVDVSESNGIILDREVTLEIESESVIFEPES